MKARAIGLMLSAVLALPALVFGQEPNTAPAEAAAGAESEAHAEAAAHSDAPNAGVIFQGLFKHLEAHPVTAVWVGGSKGFGFVKPYATDAAGQPLALDSHRHPVKFHGHEELRAYYAAQFGGGQGWLIGNVITVQWIAAVLLLVIMALIVAPKAKRLNGQAPRGRFYHLLEAVVLYVRDDMVYKIMGKEHGRRFLPLFLTQFFFILMLNLLGLFPFAVFGLMGLDGIAALGATATANIAVTAGLAFTTLIWIHLSGIREHGFVHHWKNFIPHGLPWYVLPVIIPVELLGMVVKPAALTIRLFANMTAGHLVILSFFGLIYLFQSYLVGAPVLGVAIAIACLELFVCFVQAYIFTYLSIIFVGASVHPEH
ncbi:MAG: F0F1 ATP synthase subunit A [Planctomycetota bacterium]